MIRIFLIPIKDTKMCATLAIGTVVKQDWGIDLCENNVISLLISEVKDGDQMGFLVNDKTNQIFARLDIENIDQFLDKYLALL